MLWRAQGCQRNCPAKSTPCGNLCCKFCWSAGRSPLTAGQQFPLRAPFGHLCSGAATECNTAVRVWRPGQALVQCRPVSAGAHVPARFCPFLSIPQCSCAALLRTTVPWCAPGRHCASAARRAWRAPGPWWKCNWRAAPRPVGHAPCLRCAPRFSWRSPHFCPGCARCPECAGIGVRVCRSMFSVACERPWWAADAGLPNASNFHSYGTTYKNQQKSWHAVC